MYIRFSLLFSVVFSVLIILALEARSPLSAALNSHIAAVVNDAVITAQELNERINLSMSLSQIKNTKEARVAITPQILRKMIDEQLQLQEGKRLSILASGADIDERIKLIERDNRLPSGGLAKEIEKNGLSIESFRNQLRADISWVRLVLQTLKSQVRITDNEIETRIKQLENRQGRPEYMVAEIFLPFDDGGGNKKSVRNLANELLKGLKEGRNFTTLARQFSRSSSSGSGGLLGWISEGMIDPVVFAAVEKMPSGGAEMVETSFGYYVIAVPNKRISGQTIDVNASTVTISELTLPLPPNYDPKKIPMNLLLNHAGGLVSSKAQSCAQLPSIGRELGGSVKNLGSKTLATLGQQLATAAQRVPIGKILPPFPAQNSIKILMLCSRENVTMSILPTERQMKDILENERIEILGRRYLRDLRRSAFIDVRM